MWQGLANLAWSYASLARCDESLFLPLGDEVASRLRSCNAQELANTAWAFAVSDVRSHTLFGSNSDFIAVCSEVDWNNKQLCQLHQWSLWREEVMATSRLAAKDGASKEGRSGSANSSFADCEDERIGCDWPGLPESLQHRAKLAFSSSKLCPSRMQTTVRYALESLGLSVAEEVRNAEGYSLDLAVEWGGVRVGVEVDGPSHFLGDGRPTGSTMLKRRQLRRFGWCIVAVPYFDWEAVRNGTDDRFEQRAAECSYLASLLDEATGLRTHASGDGWVAIDCTSLRRDDDAAWEWDRARGWDEDDLPSYVDDGEADPCLAPPDAGALAEQPAESTDPPSMGVRPVL